MEHNRRSTAIHEAGHAAVAYFCGFGNCIVKIDMRGNELNHAYVRNAARVSIAYVKAFHANKLRDESVAAVMRELAGSCAAGKLEGNADWFIDEFDYWRDCEPDPDTDIGRAVEWSQYLHGDTGRRPYRFLTTVAGWTQEAIELPHVWTAIEALADRLETCQRMQGATVIKVIEAATGPDTEKTWKLPRKWTRRLFQNR